MISKRIWHLEVWTIPLPIEDFQNIMMDLVPLTQVYRLFNDGQKLWKSVVSYWEHFGKHNQNLGTHEHVGNAFKICCQDIGNLMSTNMMNNFMCIGGKTLKPSKSRKSSKAPFPHKEKTLSFLGACYSTSFTSKTSFPNNISPPLLPRLNASHFDWPWMNQVLVGDLFVTIYPIYIPIINLDHYNKITHKHIS